MNNLDKADDIALEDLALVDPIISQILNLADADNLDGAISLARQSYEIMSRRAFSLGLVDQLNQESAKDTTPRQERTEGFKGITFRAISSLDNYIRNKKFDIMARSTNAPSLVIQGDSWVSFPFVIRDLGVQLSDHFPSFCIGCPGDDISDMAAAEKLDELLWTLDYTKADILILSGGGNEMIGEDFPSVLNAKEQVGFITREKLEQKIDIVSTGLHKIIQSCLEKRPNLRIFMHGYDRPVPKKNATWLGAVLEESEIPDQSWFDVCASIIDRYNLLLKSLETQFPAQFYLVDLRGISANVNPAWHDEIHLSTNGYGKAAQRFIEAIEGKV